jgi:hypothetical protein
MLVRLVVPDRQERLSTMTEMRIRHTVCPSCGHPGRLVIATPREVISRCPLCGDEMRVESAVAAAVPSPVRAQPVLSATGTHG